MGRQPVRPSRQENAGWAAKMTEPRRIWEATWSSDCQVPNHSTTPQLVVFKRFACTPPVTGSSLPTGTPGNTTALVTQWSQNVAPSKGLKSTLELPPLPPCSGPRGKSVIPPAGLLATLPAEPRPVVSTTCGSLRLTRPAAPGGRHVTEELLLCPPSPLRGGRRVRRLGPQGPFRAPLCPP